MAPVRPPRIVRSSGTSRRQPDQPVNSNLQGSTPIPTSKRDKRLVKHSILVSKARASARVTKPTSKRRRPAKKLKAAQKLDELAASLPEVSATAHEKSQSSKEKRQTVEGGLASKPGMQKRRDRITQLERARFSKNLSMMRAHSQPMSSQEEGSAREGVPDASSIDHWAALRQHIGNSLKG